MKVLVKTREQLKDLEFKPNSYSGDYTGFFRFKTNTNPNREFQSYELDFLGKEYDVKLTTDEISYFVLSVGKFGNYIVEKDHVIINTLPDELFKL